MTALNVVRVEPIGIDLEVMPGETVMQAAERRGYYWPTVCGGVTECGACRCEVQSGAELAGSAEGREIQVLRGIGLSAGRFRLACCLVPVGPLVVLKVGVRAW